jgi:hypothetical protein
MWLTFNGLQGIMFWKIELFITTAVRPRTPNWWNFTHVSEDHSAFFSGIFSTVKMEAAGC